MTLDQLRVFVAVAEREHVTRAAEALHMTQSATSAAIAALEQRHDVRLFHRVGRRIELTQAGHLFLNEARAVLARAAVAEQALSELGTLDRGKLLVQASQTIASYWLPQRLVQFRRQHPGITIELVVGNTSQVAQAVREGTAELGFVEGAVDAEQLEIDQVGQDRLALLVAPGHEWASRTALTASDLRHADWVLREPGSGTRSEFEVALVGAGIDPSQLRIVLELPSNEAVRAAVEAGAGATALSELVAAPAVRAGALARIPFTLPERPFHVLRHGQRYRSRAAETFLAQLRQD